MNNDVYTTYFVVVPVMMTVLSTRVLVFLTLLLISLSFLSELL